LLVVWHIKLSNSQLNTVCLFCLQEKDALFSRCDEKNIGTLDFAGVQKLSVEMFKMFTRFGQQQTGKFRKSPLML